MSEPVFRRWVLALVLVGAVVSFATFLVLLVFGDEMAAPPSHGADGYSVSAIGHRAFARLLAESGFVVTTSRFDSARRAGKSSLLVVAEPDLLYDDSSALRLFTGMIHRSGPTLVVLPRRTGFGDSDREGFVSRVYEEDVSTPQSVLAFIDKTLRVVRRSPGDHVFDPRDWGPPPSLPGPIQLISPSPNLEPLVSLGEYVLLGRVIPKGEDDPSEVYVLSDPDLIATHGLVRESNATLAVSIVERLRPPAGGVYFDETLHGYDVRPSLARELFHPPLVFATGSACFAGLLLVAAGLGRFGRPKAPAPSIEPGKRFLVDHTADLLRQGGHAAHALERYLAATVQDAGRALHAPLSLDANGLREWLARAERRDGATPSLDELGARVARAKEGASPRTVVEAAMAVHDWKERTTNGPREDS